MVFSNPEAWPYYSQVKVWSWRKGSQENLPSKPAITTICETSFDDTSDIIRCRRKSQNVFSLPSWLQWLSNGSENSGWKPVTFKAPVLGTFILASISIIATLEVLSWMSLRPQNGTGIAFASDVNNITSTTTFGYLYLPTILAVCYSMLWSWVDLDVKRLEPWFQLSKRDGAGAKHSLLLEYPFDFLPFVPITALRKKHWGVFFAGIIMLMIFWIVTPFQSAIFSTGVVVRSIATTMITTATLSPITSHATTLSANFMDTAYGIAWLGQALPSYTTGNFAFLPYQPIKSYSSSLPTETWSTSVEAFHTNLTCTPAIVEKKGTGYTFSNGKGCVVPEIALMNTTGETKYMVLYIGYFDDPHNDWSLQNPNCSRKFANSFLALWASSTSYTSKGYTNLTSLFCETSYSSQDVYVSVNASSRLVDSYKVVEPVVSKATTNLSSIFNITNFEYLLGTGVPATALSQRFDFTDQVILQQDPHISDAGITWPNTNMIGFAVGLNDVPIEEWSQPSVLHRVFENVHQLLFTTAFSTLVTTREEFVDPRPGILHDKPGAIILVRSISIIVEGALAIITIFTICLWYYSFHRRSALTSDPASIADVMAMVQHNDEMCADMHDDGNLSSPELTQALQHSEYQLRPSGGRLRILPLPSTTHPVLQSRDPSLSEDRPSEKLPAVQPWELSIFSGVAFILIILIALAGLVYLYNWSKNSNGIPLPSNSQVVRSIIENYAPTTFATLIEPIWMILNRILCLLLPLEELRKGNAASSTSVAAKYTSVPPQLAVWRAVKAKHFLLAAVCLVAVSTNVLAVALSAVLNEGTAVVQIPFQTKQQLSPVFNGTPIFFSDGSAGLQQYYDHFYVVLANVSHGASMPPWTDDKFFYLPFDIKTTSEVDTPQRALQSFRGTTTGFGTNVSCVQMTSTSFGVNNELLFDVNSNGTSIQFATNYVLNNRTKIKCVFPRGQHVFDPAFETTADISAYKNGPSALEAVQHMTKSQNSADEGFCAAALLMGWVRVGAGTPQTRLNTTTFINRPVSQTFISCTQQLLTAQFEINVDVDGRILESNQTSDFVADVKPYFTTLAASSTVTLTNETSLFQQSTELIASAGLNDFAWHNDSFTSDWMNSLLGRILHSNELVNPLSPLPNATLIGPVVEDLYTKLFAILLGLNTHVFPTSATPMIANTVFIETRLFVSPLMFKLSIVILSLHLIVAILYYLNRPNRFLPRMPTSIASIIAFVAASRAVNDFNGNDERGSGGGEARRYGYGRFIGADGRTKVGIEKQRYVVPLEVQNPHVKRRKWWTRVGKGDEGEVKSWI